MTSLEHINSIFAHTIIYGWLLLLPCYIIKYDAALQLYALIHINLLLSVQGWMFTQRLHMSKLRCIPIFVYLAFNILLLAISSKQWRVAILIIEPIILAVIALVSMSSEIISMLKACSFDQTVEIMEGLGL